MARIAYNLRQALTQLWRNKGMALASTAAITAMMLILGLFFVISVNVNLFTETLRNNYNEVEVFLNDTVTEDGAKDIMAQLESNGSVTDIQFRTKEEAMKILKQRWGENSYLLDTLGNNPLPNSILLSVDSMKTADRVTKKAESIDGVEDVKYYKETVEKLTRVTGLLQTGAIVIMLFLVIVSVVVVSNTIKLTVLARAREISIMKYIGATNWFIRGPLLVEGILIGMLASAFAAGLTFALYSRVSTLVGKQLITIMSAPLVPAPYLALNLVLIFLAMGISIGACGSIISMRRFLDK